jgi:hypothetical protein
MRAAAGGRRPTPRCGVPCPASPSTARTCRS